MVQPGSGRQQEKWQQLAINQKEKIMGIKKRLEAFHPLTNRKWKRCQKDEEDMKEITLNYLRIGSICRLSC
jgi:hypothetical protein